MRVNKCLLDLYFDSAEGQQLHEGFEALLQQTPNSEGSRAKVEAPDEDSLCPEGEAFWAFFEGVDGFHGVWPAVKRVLSAVAPISSDQESRRVYLDLLEKGFEVIEADHQVHNQFARAIGILEPKEGDNEGAHPSLDTGSEVDDDAEADPSAPGETLGVELFGGAEADGLKRWAGNISEISWGLHLLFPEWFVPYCFPCRFHHFDAICAEFGIALPRLPGKSSRKELAAYYFSINQCLQDYRRQLDVTPAKFNAFLYGFACNYVEIADEDELPEPERAWLLLGHPEGDYEWLEAADEDSISYWQGSDGIRPGDLCIMWVRTPHSCTHSIWRAISRGYNDPFFWHYRTVWIGHRTLVPRIKFKELSSNPVWAETPSIRAHFQGASGREIKPAEYEALVSLWKERGCDVSTLPHLAKPVQLPVDGVASERDVEILLLEPLLRRLGYEETDWVRQYRVRMGRGERVRPDYALGLQGVSGEDTVQMLVEAKHRISTSEALREAYVQARSYAERLRAQTIVLCAVEGLWIFRRTHGSFSSETFEQLGWFQANEGKALDDLMRSLGKEVILKGVERRGGRIGS
jgi:hypothetical protein